MSDLLKLPCGGGLFDSESFSIEKKNGKEYIKAKNKGGVSSWNDIPDRPFGEEGWSITWGGNTEGRESVSIDEITVYKVSDKVLTKNDFVGATIIVDGNETVLTEEFVSAVVSEVADGIVSMNNPFIVSADKTSFEVGGTTFELPSVGTYFATALTLEHKSIKTIDPKYLPNQITITGRSEGNYSVDVNFEEAWEMSASTLCNLLVYDAYSMNLGHGLSCASVEKSNNNTWGTNIVMRFAGVEVSTDMTYSEKEYVFMWTSGGLRRFEPATKAT